MTTPSTSSRPASGGGAASMFAGDPLQSWANDDVLLTKPARDRLAAEHPRALRVLDWPELRLLFASYEAPATEEASFGRRRGRLAIAAGVGALVVAALALLIMRGQLQLGLMVVIVAAAAGGFAVWRLRGGGRSARGLASRFWTERARALYFQMLINNLALAAEAMTDDKAFGAWKRARAEALEALPMARQLPDRMRELVKDMGEEEVWIVPAWRTPAPLPPPSAELDVLLERLSAQRFDTQIAYIGHKLGDTVPAGDAEAARNARFRAGVLSARAQFDGGGLADKVAALRAMEGHAYRDLRDFLTAHVG